MQTAQVKTTGRFGAFRAALAAGLAFWVVIVALFAASSVDSGGADAAINAAFVAAFLLAGAGFAAAICKVGGAAGFLDSFGWRASRPRCGGFDLGVRVFQLRPARPPPPRVHGFVPAPLRRHAVAAPIDARGDGPGRDARRGGDDDGLRNTRSLPRPQSGGLRGGVRRVGGPLVDTLPSGLRLGIFVPARPI